MENNLVVDAHRGDEKRFVVRAGEKPTLLRKRLATQ
jgi:hypothetical protein